MWLSRYPCVLCICCSCYAAELFSCAVASVTRRRMRVTGPETDHLQPVCQARERLFSCYIRVFLHDEIRCFSCHYICIFLCVFFSLRRCVLYPTNTLISATLLCFFFFLVTLTSHRIIMPPTLYPITSRVCFRKKRRAV